MVGSATGNHEKSFGLLHDWQFAHNSPEVNGPVLLVQATQHGGVDGVWLLIDLLEGAAVVGSCPQLVLCLFSKLDVSERCVKKMLVETKNCLFIAWMLL